MGRHAPGRERDGLIEPETPDLNEALAGDLNGAFERLVLTYQDRMYSFALRMTGRREDAEEVAQDAFVRAYRALADYAPERIRDITFTAWLYRITLNVVRNRLRRKRPRVVPLDGPDGMVVDPPDRNEEGPEAVVERGEGASELAALVAEMPGRYRAAVVLRHVEGRGYEEVAAILGQPVGTVKANVHRGVRWLREALTKTMSEVG